ncbi:MAG TPA: hypothetical protein VGK23_00790 [Methanomassiliicoccales archaeon]|jgi:hypothetical protein
MAEADIMDWEGLIAKVKAPCSGCPRSGSKTPVIFNRKTSLGNVEFIVVSQEPGFWLRANPARAEEDLLKLCRTGKPSLPDVKQANPLTKILQIFNSFDPTGDRIYWTHALKCIPSKSDRDVNKEWRKAATRCEELFLDEIRLLGRRDVNIIAFGKYALEMCLHAFAGHDLDQELSISEFMQNNRFPLAYRYKFKDGSVKNISLYVYGNPSSEVVTIKKSGGKMTVEEIQEIETKRIRELMTNKPRP